MRKLLLLLLLFLAACSPQNTNSTWLWVFLNGMSIQIPADWLLIQRFPDILILKDTDSSFRISLEYYPNEEDSHEHDAEYDEITLEDDIRLLRKETFIETPIEGFNELVSYLAIYPNLYVLSANFPKTANIAERERLFRELALSFQSPVENTHAFIGGYAGIMTYSDNWELWNWSRADSPEFRTPQTRLTILLIPKGFGLSEFSQEEIDAMSYEELAHNYINLYERPVTGELEYENFSGTLIVSYPMESPGISVFSVDGEEWFRFSYTNSDTGDIADIHEMMHAIIASYHFSDLKPYLARFQIEPNAESTEE